MAPTSAATASVFAQTCQKFGVLEQTLLDHSTNTISHGIVATCANGQKDVVKGSITIWCIEERTSSNGFPGFEAEFRWLSLQPETVRLVRGKTGWSTAASFVKSLKMLRDALSLWPDIQPILVMDCAPAHLAESVVQAASNQGLFTAVCPAGLTP